jgi:hypothetical protein
MPLRQRLLCASAFTKQAAGVSGPAAAETARFLNGQAEKVLSGEAIDRPCPPSALPDVPDVPEPTPVDLPGQYAQLVRETQTDIDALQGFRADQEKTRVKKEEVQAKLAETREKAKEAKAAPAPAKPEPGKDPGKDSTLLAELKALEADLAAELSDLDKKEKELSSSIENVTDRLQKRQQSLLADAGPKSPTGGLK